MNNIKKQIDMDQDKKAIPVEKIVPVNEQDKKILQKTKKKLLDSIQKDKKD